MIPAAGSYCGPICLYLAARSLEKEVTFEEVIRLTRADKNQGVCSFADLKEAAKTMGMEAKAVKLTPAQIRELVPPAIVYVGSSSRRGAHFLLINAVRGDDFQVLNYPYDPYLYPKEEAAILKDRWEGYVLLISNRSLRRPKIWLGCITIGLGALLLVIQRQSQKNRRREN